MKAKREQPELTAVHSDYVEPFKERPPWWRDAEYHWSGRSRTVPPTLFGRKN